LLWALWKIPKRKKWNSISPPSIYPSIHLSIYPSLFVRRRLGGWQIGRDDYPTPKKIPTGLQTAHHRAGMLSISLVLFMVWKWPILCGCVAAQTWSVCLLGVFE
jgi:hypothetical protein